MLLNDAVDAVGALTPEERARSRAGVMDACAELKRLLDADPALSAVDRDANKASAPTSSLCGSVKRRLSSRVVPTAGGSSDDGAAAALAPAAVGNAELVPVQSTQSGGEEELRDRRGSNAILRALTAASKKIIREISPAQMQTKLKASEVEDFRNAFNRVDLNGNGRLDAGELLSVMGLLGMTITMEEIQTMMQEFDTDHDGELDFSEFIVSLQQSRVGRVSLATRRMAMLNTKVTLAYGDKKSYTTVGSSDWVIHPKSAFHMAWDVFITALLLLTLIVMPISLAFEGINTSLFAFNLAIDLLFLVDVVKQFNTGILDEKESEIIMDRRLIVRHYLRSWFFIDFTSSIPIDALLKLAEGSGGAGSGSELARSSKLLKMLRLLRLAKLMKLLKMSSIFKYARTVLTYLEDHYHITISDSALKLIRLGFLVLMLAHWMGCINFMICRLFGEAGPIVDGIEGAWQFPKDSWVHLSGLHLQPESSQYPWSLFKALCLMMQLGFESPPPMNSNCTGSPTSFMSEWCEIESWLTLVCLMVGSIFYAVLIANVSTIVHTMTQSRQEYLGKLRCVAASRRRSLLTRTLPALVLLASLAFSCWQTKCPGWATTCAPSTFPCRSATRCRRCTTRASPRARCTTRATSCTSCRRAAQK